MLDEEYHKIAKYVSSLAAETPNIQPFSIVLKSLQGEASIDLQNHTLTFSWKNSNEIVFSIIFERFS